MKKIVGALIVCCFALCVALPAGASYKKDVRTMTKGDNLYDLVNGNARILMKATLFTDDFRRAFAEKDAEVHYLDDAATADLVAAQMAEQPKGWEIVIGMYTPKDYNKFTLQDDSFWQAHLVTSLGETVDPVRIEEIKVDPYWRVMFPHLTRWMKMYRVVFPKAALGEKATLVMQSVVGEVGVEWKIREE